MNRDLFSTINIEHIYHSFSQTNLNSSESAGRETVERAIAVAHSYTGVGKGLKK